MTAKQELYSWLFWGNVDTQAVPDVNAQAPSVSDIVFPRADGKPVVIAFLRHCGCPFAEKTFLLLRTLAKENPDVEFIAVSHSDKAATDAWVTSVGGAGDVQVVVDEKRQIYGAFGLGISGLMHFLSPSALASVFKLGRNENIWNRPTASGTRWQKSGLFAIDAPGNVRYSHPATSADDLGSPEDAVKSVKSTAKL